MITIVCICTHKTRLAPTGFSLGFRLLGSCFGFRVYVLGFRVFGFERELDQGPNSQAWQNDQLPQCPKCLRLRRLSASRWMFRAGPRAAHTFWPYIPYMYNHDHQYHQLVSIHLVTVLCVTWMIFSAVLIQYHCSVLLRGSDVCEKYTGKASADGQGPQWLDGWNAESKKLMLENFG